jgi:hypothetical protein
LNSGKKTRTRLQPRPISDGRAERLVYDWANTVTLYPIHIPLTESARERIRRTDAAILRLVKRYPEVFCSLPAVPDSPATRDSDVATEHWDIVARVQQFLRLAWDASEMREREWHIFAARHEFHSDTVYTPVVMERMRRRVAANQPLDDVLSPEEDALRLSVPALTAFEQAMYHLQRIAKRMRHCKNPECPAPYFLGKKGQKYCCSECSAPMQRAQKREWWREHRAKVQ